jgi:hypothetical protein
MIPTTPSQPVNAAPTGVLTHVTVEVLDYEALGRWLADQTSDAQAALLVGFVQGISAAPDSSPIAWRMQDAWIARGIAEQHPEEVEPVCEWLVDLHGSVMLARDAVKP